MIENTLTPQTDHLTLSDRAKNLWDTKRNAILIALGVVLLLIAGIVGYRMLVTEPNERKASESMFRAEEYFKQDSLKLALNGDNINLGFLKIISRFDGTKAANLAHYYAGYCYLRLGDFNNAVKHLKDFSTSSKQIEARATSLLGDAYSELNKKEEAAALYSKAGKMFEKDDYNSPKYLFRAAYLYEQLGKNKDALENYRLIKEKYARSEEGFEVDKYLARLGEVGTDDK
ncbi:MAG: tetratricopeptide repeat protein [Williamsia sp.]|nr:tetratricopeptide repeat protein [Williamsia sp.]